MIILFCTLLLINCQSKQTEEKGKILFDQVDSVSLDSATSKQEGVQKTMNETGNAEDKIQPDPRGSGPEQIDQEVTFDTKRTSPTKPVVEEDSAIESNDKAVNEDEPPPKMPDQDVDSNAEDNPLSEDYVITTGGHEIWDGLLKKYVDPSGKVDYTGFVRERKALEQYLDQLSADVPSAQTTTSEQLAYWINAYNAFTVYLIVKNHPVKSILDLNNGKPWDLKWIEIGSHRYSLNDIEHSIIRKRYADPRIHFAVNCASKSCPPLASVAFTSDNYESLAERLTKEFVNDPSYNRITSDKVELSKIFEWYAADFDDLISFLNRYSQTKINDGASISYREYDWSLNGR